MRNANAYKYFIGIDSGKTTGVAVWDYAQKKLIEVKSMLIHQALEFVHHYQICQLNQIYVIVEDARQATFMRYNKTEMAKLKGAGSIMRDATIWEDFLKDKCIAHSMRRPNKNLTKFTQENFQKLTGWEERTNSHARDAALLVFGR